MDDRSNNSDEQETGPIGGERLRAARRANDISVRDIAKELHLDEHKVRALEENNFDVLGAPVFAKGHLRKYAELVGIAVEDILSDYYQMNRAAGAPPVVGPKRQQPRDFNPVPWIVGALAILVIGAATYWWFTRTPAPESSAAIEPATLAPFASEPDGEESVVGESQEDSGDDVADTLEVAEDPEPVESAPLVTEPIVQDAAASDLPQVQIQLTYSGDCWTEVTDASGQRLFYDLGAAGRTVTVGGDAPLRLILGDGDNVSISVAGRPFTIPNSARSGRLARLTINRP